MMNPNVYVFRETINQHCLQATTVVDEKIRHEIDLGRVAGPFRDIPFVNVQSSPLGLIKDLWFGSKT